MSSIQREDHQPTALLVRLEKIGVVERPDAAAASTVRDRDVLLALRRKGGGIAMDTRTYLVGPEILSGLIVQSVEVTIRVTVEDQAATRGEDTAAGRPALRFGPYKLAG